MKVGVNNPFDEEIFIVGRESGLLLITAVVPSVGDVRQDYGTVQKWFTDLKIPMTGGF